ncbi:MAG: LytTR family transcriptional regulator [Brevundimonas sp.]|nr:MAG: LytTR family transcriptional regulator [Brevundimonas sp.]
MRLDGWKPREFGRGLVVAGLGGIVLAFTGAFETYRAPLEVRLAYWLPMMILGGVWGHACSVLLDRFVALDEKPWLNVGLLTAAISGPLAVAVWAFTGPALNGRWMPLSLLPTISGYVVLVTAVICAINVFVTRARPIQTHAPAVGQARARFPDRLPIKLKGAAIRAVQAEDHYLRVHTDRGSDLILMRLSDALEELEGLEGAQTHRSWWVARDAVRDVERGDGRAALTLDGGLVAPVSRRYARALREAGWY